MKNSGYWVRFPYGLILSLLACQDAPTTRPQYRPIVEAVYASGTVLPADDYKIYAQADGVITARLVNEGETVAANQPLFRLENTSQQARVASANEALRQAEANLAGTSPVLQELETQLASLRSRVADDSTNYVRYQNLWRQNATARVNLDRAQLAYQTSRNEFAAARERLRRTRNQLRLERTNAQATARINATDAANAIVRSDIAGTVYELTRKQGEAVRRGEVLASVGRSGQYYLRLWVDEQDVARVSAGQEALVKLDMYPGQTFPARIAKVYPTLNPENQSVRADAVFTGTPPKVVANAAVEANLIIQRKTRTLTVPKALVVNDSVTVQGPDGKPKRVRIQSGIATTDFVEVLNGLDTSSVLLLGGN
jgi:multidrug efflux pump subunit AcrA (membrane-fusion protein)